MLPHPQVVGMTLSIGLPEGQVADYRYAFSDGSGVHVKDFGGHYQVHLDEVHPGVDPIEHLRRDAPEALIGGSVALGAIIGGIFGKSWQSALTGAAIAGLAGVILAAKPEEEGGRG